MTPQIIYERIDYMFYKHKTSCGEKIIEVTEIITEKEGKIDEYDRVFYGRPMANASYMYRFQFEQNYEPLPLPEGTPLCTHCGFPLEISKKESGAA